jgi:hypothetical protein
LAISFLSLTHLQDDEIDYTGMFDNVPTALLRLFVLLTTENFPGVMMPAYRVKHSSFAYFGMFLATSLFFIVPMQVAVCMVSACALSVKVLGELSVCCLSVGFVPVRSCSLHEPTLPQDAFWTATKDLVKKDRKKERKKLIEAFNFLGQNTVRSVSLSLSLSLSLFVSVSLSTSLSLSLSLNLSLFSLRLERNEASVCPRLTAQTRMGTASSTRRRGWSS